jgi:hypothetical protein
VLLFPPRKWNPSWAPSHLYIINVGALRRKVTIAQILRKCDLSLFAGGVLHARPFRKKEGGRERAVLAVRTAC